MYFSEHKSWLHEFIKWLRSSGMQQQQPATVTHSRISSLLISRHLTSPRVASRYSVWTFMCPKVGVAAQKFSGRTPLSDFLNPPLSLGGLTLYDMLCTRWICSAQSGNLCNLEIALRILRILRLCSNLEIAHCSCAISRLRNYSAQSSDCTNYVPTVSTAS